MAEKGLIAAIAALVARLFGRAVPEQDAEQEFGSFFGRPNGPASGGIEGR